MKKKLSKIMFLMLFAVTWGLIPASAEEGVLFKEQEINKDDIIFKEQEVNKSDIVFKEQTVNKEDIVFTEQVLDKSDIVFVEQTADTLSLKEQQADKEEQLLQQANLSFRKGVQYMKMKSYDSAMTMFKEALSYNPKLSDAYYNIALIYVAKKDYDEAYNNYVKAIALNPRDYDAVLQAAKISYNRGNYSLALKYLKHIPDDYEKYFLVQQVKQDAQEQFDIQSGTIERSKIASSTPAKHVIIDRFNSPAGMVVDSKGNMFVASYSDNAIIKVDKNKVKTNLVKDYLLEGPVGLAIDKYDNIYVANFDADNILKITKSGLVTIFMERVAKPYFLYIKDDVLYVSEQGNNVVLTYDLSTSK